MTYHTLKACIKRKIMAALVHCWIWLVCKIEIQNRLSLYSRLYSSDVITDPIMFGNSNMKSSRFACLIQVIFSTQNVNAWSIFTTLPLGVPMAVPSGNSTARRSHSKWDLKPRSLPTHHSSICILWAESCVGGVWTTVDTFSGEHQEASSCACTCQQCWDQTWWGRALGSCGWPPQTVHDCWLVEGEHRFLQPENLFESHCTWNFSIHSRWL